ncbi:MAG: SDR family oxidoreductase [Gorillibacterium sp.]|nr:SDR family oxidoreductase [Gorillibacterium sp.]
MGKIVVTGATGGLGGAVVQYLLQSGLGAENIAVVARDPQKAVSLSELGIEVRQGDYDDPASLVAAFAVADKLLFISSSSLDNTLRIRQHATVVEAARNAKVGHLLYTSLAFAENMHISLENVHLATEYMIRTTGIPYTFLRNGFYLSILVNEGLLGAVASGKLYSTTGNSKVNYVDQADLARAAAVALTSEGHENKTYNLVYPQPFTYDEFADILSKASGQPIKHQSITPTEAIGQMAETGIPAGVASFLVHVIYAAVAEGQFSHASDDLVRLIGDNWTPLQTSVELVLAQ